METSRFLGLLLLGMFTLATGSLWAADFNAKYAAPFGVRPDARVENTVRFSYFTEQGKVQRIDKPVHGGIFGLQLAMEDSFGFEISTVWRRMEENFTTENVEKPCSERGQECFTEYRDFSGSGVVIGLTPKYRYLNLEWLWASVSLTGNFPLANLPDESRSYEIDPGLQFYFDTGDWVGIELDLAYLLHINDPEEIPYAPGYESAPQDDEQLVSGLYGRANFLLKIIGRHFVGLQVEDTVWLHTLDELREEEIVKRVQRIEPVKTEKDRVDLTFYSNHRLNVGGGYRVNLGVFEGGVGGFAAVTDRDKRQGWGVNADTRFTF